MPFGKEFPHFAAILARAQHVHVQRAVAHFVVKIDRVRIPVARMRSQVDVP